MISDFRRECPILWELVTGLATPSLTRWQSKEYQDNLPETSEHHAYFIMNHLLKLRGGSHLSARATIVGIFMDTQGDKFTCGYSTQQSVRNELKPKVLLTDSESKIGLF